MESHPEAVLERGQGNRMETQIGRRYLRSAEALSLGRDC